MLSPGGSTGSTTAGYWSPSETSRQQRPKTATTLRSNCQPWQRDSNQTASGKPGAIQFVFVHPRLCRPTTMLSAGASHHRVFVRFSTSSEIRDDLVPTRHTATAERI